MIKYTVNGHFLCRNLTGIERFSFEILKKLDELIPQDYISILIPKNANQIPMFKNIKVVVSKKELKSFWKWTQFTFASFVIKNKTIGINFANECSLLSPGYTFIHDIYCKKFPHDFTSLRDKMVKLYSCFMYWFSAKFSKKIFTVSNFSKEQIVETYGISPSKITVIPNGWDHFKNIKEDDSIFSEKKLPDNFYFTLGSLSKRKNLKWIADYAQKHSEENFAISGKMISGLVPKELELLKNMKNIHLLGYLSDGQVKSLMSRCKAFIFPSYYEGFGIPPLEALSVGAKVIVSNSSCLPEIYKNYAYYINPDSTDIDLSDILMKKLPSPKPLLEHYTYENSAKILYDKLTNFDYQNF